MTTHVSAHLSSTVEVEGTIVFAIAVAQGTFVEESLVMTLDGAPVEPDELVAEHGTRLHRLVAPPGQLVVDYAASVTGETAVSATNPAAPIDEVDLIRYRRPSRYCESDTLTRIAQEEFIGLTGVDLLTAVSSWVGTRLDYIPGSSRPTDGAVSTMLAREGVCRDYAHLVVALLRALGMPARQVAAYAPGLTPMDFHAVVEAYVEGAWHVVDATTLAPRQSLVRIATGADAADTAFMDVLSGVVTLDRMAVTATSDALADDDLDQLVQIR